MHHLLCTTDPLEFKGLASYKEKLEQNRAKTKLEDAVLCGMGMMGGREVSLAVMDFRFLGGSMGSVVGEKITRQGVNVGLDDLHESDLAPGSLTRAMNDFFNAFQELSASPHEETIKQELLHKIDTLTKRFNEAGERLENIDLLSTSRSEEMGFKIGISLSS